MDYASGLGVGQDVVVPSLYGLCYACDQGPDAHLLHLPALRLLQGTSTSGVSHRRLESALHPPKP